MKKTLILLSPLAALAIGTAIPATRASASGQVDYSRAFLLPYNVTGQAVLATHFEDAPDLDNSTVFPVDRDYGQKAAARALALYLFILHSSITSSLVMALSKIWRLILLAAVV